MKLILNRSIPGTTTKATSRAIGITRDRKIKRFLFFAKEFIILLLSVINKGASDQPPRKPYLIPSFSLAAVHFLFSSSSLAFKSNPSVNISAPSFL